MVIDDKPPEHPTKRLEQDAINSALLKKLQDTVEGGFARLSADIGLVADDLRVTKDRIILVENRVGDLEGRITRNSNRVRENSEQDLGQDAAIAEIRVDVATIKTETAAQTASIVDLKRETGAQTLLLEKLLKLTEKPVVKLIATAIGTAILTWLSTRGVR